MSLSCGPMSGSPRDACFTAQSCHNDLYAVMNGRNRDECARHLKECVKECGGGGAGGGEDGKGGFPKGRAAWMFNGPNRVIDGMTKAEKRANAWMKLRDCAACK